MQQATILVIGAGIGGLTAAIALGRRGFRVDMIERDPDWSVYGVGIIQQSNVVRAMHALGILQDYLDAGVGFDYVFIPAGGFTEASDGTALLTCTLRREDNFDDRWNLSLVLSNRVDPGDGAYPPSQGPVLGLVSSAYVAAGESSRLTISDLHGKEFTHQAIDWLTAK